MIHNIITMISIIISEQKKKYQQQILVAHIQRMSVSLYHIIEIAIDIINFDSRHS